jgi:hypothetical protein
MGPAAPPRHTHDGRPRHQDHALVVESFGRTPARQDELTTLAKAELSRLS